MSSPITPEEDLLGLLEPGPGVRYLVVSEGGRQRFAFPTANASILGASMAAYRPTTARALVAWRTAGVIARVGLGTLLPGRRISLRPRLGPFLAKIAGVSEIYVAAASSFHGDRCVLGMIDARGKLLGFAKVATHTNTAAVDRLRAEAEILRRLHGRLGSVEIPSVLYLGPVENFEVLVITPIAGRPRFDASTLTRRRVEAAGQIFSLRGPTTTISEHLGFQVDDAGWDRRRIAVLSVTERTADAPVPSGLVHGDFAPWNVIDDGRRVGLIDWEYSRPDGLPFWDLWHFAVLTAVSVGSDRMRRSILRAAGGEGRLAEAIARYAEASGVPARLAPDVLLVYLVRQGATVLEQARSGATDARRGLEPWTRLLDEIIDARA